MAGGLVAKRTYQWPADDVRSSTVACTTTNMGGTGSGEKPKSAYAYRSSGDASFMTAASLQYGFQTGIRSVSRASARTVEMPVSRVASKWKESSPRRTRVYTVSLRTKKQTKVTRILA